MKRVNRFLLVSVASVLAGVNSMAMAETFTFDGAGKLILRDFIATVNIVTADVDEATISIEGGDAKSEPVLVRNEGDVIEVYSKTEPDPQDFWKRLDWRRNGDDAFRVFLEDYPVIEVTIPKSADVLIEDLAASLTIGDVDSTFTVESTVYVEGKVGNIREGDIQITGAGDLTFGEVSENLRARIAGSGELSFTKTHDTDLEIAGSGDISIMDVQGALEADIRGSGDIELGDIAGDVTLGIAGSGDIETGKVEGGAEISIRGSGDVYISSMNGPGSVDIMGNGDVEIDGGRAEDLKVSMKGSGDLEFRGIATNPTVRLNGSGDVFIRDYEGKVSTSGSGDIIIGDIKISD